MAPTLIFKEYPFEHVTILIDVLPGSMFEPMLETSIKQQRGVPKKFTIAMKAVIFPFSFIPEISIEVIDTKP